MNDIIILGIESSCDDTSAAIIRNNKLLSNCIANQSVHEKYGGVVPELASRSHQQNIVPVVDQAIKQAGISPSDISAIAFTRGPGLLGSLHVGTSFAKGLAMSLGVPIIDVNHLMGHTLALHIDDGSESYNPPPFPHLCLLVSGGNSQIIHVKDPYTFDIIGQTIDDAAGEAFDKCAKVMGLPYPGGPHVDRLAKEGKPDSIALAKPNIAGYNYSFSGLKTSFLYHLRDNIKENPNYIDENKANLCAALQKTIVETLLIKLKKAAKDYKIKDIALAGGVSANSGLRNATSELGAKFGWDVYLPKLAFTTDNAAMIAMAGYYKYKKGEFCNIQEPPYSRVKN
ncbi:MAG: tRNA (adenosine(37)-N6)-threonylcarbamoyltransferase complex transferase subunit TsaD [Bacteroidales bacterium]